MTYLKEWVCVADTATDMNEQMFVILHKVHTNGFSRPRWEFKDEVIVSQVVK